MQVCVHVCVCVNIHDVIVQCMSVSVQCMYMCKSTYVCVCVMFVNVLVQCNAYVLCTVYCCVLLGMHLHMVPLKYVCK